MVKKVIIFIIALTIIIGCVCMNMSSKPDKLELKHEIKSDINLEYILEINENLSIVQTQNDEKEEELYYDVPLSYKIQNYIKEICKTYEVDIETVLAIMKIESNFQQNLKTKNNIGGGYSIGLCQLNNNYIDWFSEITGIEDFDIDNIYHNIEGGIAVYKHYKNYWKNQRYSGEELIIRTLNSYNMGLSGYQNYITRTGLISRSYDKKILKYKKDELQYLKVTLK